MTTKPGHRPHLASSPFAPKPEPLITRFDLGDRVSHDTYGLGRVTHTEAHAVIVDFEARRVRIASPYRKMSKL